MAPPAIVAATRSRGYESVLMSDDTHYDVLGVPPSADVATLRRAYVSQARIYHPDFHLREDEAIREAAEAQMRSLNGAWEVLGQSSSRERYDRELRSMGRFEPVVPNGSTTRGANGTRVPAGETASYSAPPRWMTIAPAVCLVLALGCFILGFITGLVGVLAGGLIFAVASGLGFIIVPVVALKRSTKE